jgi:hypothetical protein
MTIHNSIPSCGKRFFSPASPDLLPTQLHIQWVLLVLSPEEKRQERELHYLPPYSEEAKDAWAYTRTSLPSSWFHVLEKEKLYFS